MDVDATLYHQDAAAIVAVDAVEIQDHYLEEATIVVYGSSFFSSAVADVAEILLAVTTAASGSSFSSSSVADAAVTHGVEMAAVTMIAAVNKTILRTENSVLFSLKDMTKQRVYVSTRIPFC